MSERWQARLWFFALAVALAATLTLTPPGPDASVEHWQLIGDSKLGRIAARFAEETPTRPPLAAWNHEGIRLDLTLDAGDLAAMRRRFNRKHYKARYVEAGLRFGDGPPLTALVALRGSRSLDEFDALSFKVKLARPELVASGVEMRRFYLMGLVEDRHKVKARFATTLYAALGLFPLYHQFVDLHLNGERQGVAMLVEPPVRGIRRTNPTTTAIYRRDSKPKIYVRYWDDETHDAEDRMQALRALNEDTHLDDPVQAYEEVLDLEAYLRFLAAASILLNEDYFGELWLYQTRRADGAPAPLRFSAWDLEDVAYLGNKQMKRGVRDPLMFWAEGIVDYQIANHPALYARYRDTLARLLESELSFDRVRDTLLAVQAMVDEIDPDAKATRARFVGRALERLRLRHATLEAALASP